MLCLGQTIVARFVLPLLLNKPMLKSAVEHLDMRRFVECLVDQLHVLMTNKQFGLLSRTGGCIRLREPLDLGSLDPDLLPPADFKIHMRIPIGTVGD